MKKVLFFITLSIIFFTSCEKEGFENSDLKDFDQEKSSTRNDDCTPISGFPSLWISEIIYNDYDLGANDDFNCESGASTYSDFTDKCIDVDPNSSHHVLLVEGSEIEFKFSVWLDLNQDGDFSDSGEQLANNVNASSSGGVVILTALNILPGKSIIRIIVSPYEIGGPCDDIEMGEIEDYSICVAECLCSTEELTITSLALGSQDPSGEGCTYSILMSTITGCNSEWISSTSMEYKVDNGATTSVETQYNFNGAGTYTIIGIYSVTDINGCTISISKTIVITLDSECNLVNQYELCDIDTPSNLNTNCESKSYTWDAVNGGTGDYEVQFNINAYIFCCNSGPTEPLVITRIVTGNELSFVNASLPSFKNGTWQVRAICGEGAYSEWSDVVPILLCFNQGGGIGGD